MPSVHLTKIDFQGVLRNNVQRRLNKLELTRQKLFKKQNQNVKFYMKISLTFEIFVVGFIQAHVFFKFNIEIDEDTIFALTFRYSFHSYIFDSEMS